MDCRKIYRLSALLAFCLALVGCVREEMAMEETPADNGIVGEFVEAYLDLSVGGISIDSPSTKTEDPSPYPEDDTERERYIKEMWVFQFNAAGTSLVNGAQHVTVSDQAQLRNMKVDGVLTDNDGAESIVYIVANVGGDSWVSTSGLTLESLKSATIPNPDPIFANASDDWAIPMSGQTEGTVKIESGVVVTVPVTRMFAKLMIAIPVEDNGEDTAELTSLEISRVPSVCQVSTIYSAANITLAGTYPTGTTFMPWAYDVTSVTVDDEAEFPYVVYVPENIQGEVADNTDPDNRSNVAPANALNVTAYVDITESSGAGAIISPNKRYTCYPGGNTYDNFNVRRNCVYRITMAVTLATITPSANCIVATPGTTIAFYPYYRDETGHRDDGSGGETTTYSAYYDFENHLDYTGKDATKVIDHVQIIWQSTDASGNYAIGDNSSNKLVWYEENSESLIESKIYVTAAHTGNALIAAYNSSGTVIWSWHIWINPQRPDNVANAMTYRTLYWDGTNGVYNGITNGTSKLWVAGYPIMKCNLGALANTPEDGSATDTYGTLYQWGRKDPFPPMRRGKLSAPYDYDRTTGGVYVNDNANKEISLTDNDGSSSASGGTGVFYTVLTDDTKYISDQTTPQGGIEFTIENPTVFIACAEAFDNDSDVYNNIMNYKNQGDWLPGGGDGDLWGGNAESSMSYPICVLEEDGWEANLQDNYGTYKTIFDPCPYGWRVSPGDLWLGFTDTGKNFNESGTDVDDGTIGLHARVNCDTSKDREDIQNDLGYYMYLTGWQTGQTVFFPTQGSRWPSGQPARAGICGNYHNATVDKTTGVYYCNRTDLENYPYGIVSTSPSRFLGNKNWSLMDEAIRRVDILHMHCSNGTSAQMMCNPFEYQILYYNRAVAGPVRCVRDTER